MCYCVHVHMVDESVVHLTCCRLGLELRRLPYLELLLKHSQSELQYR